MCCCCWSATTPRVLVCSKTVKSRPRGLRTTHKTVWRSIFTQRKDAIEFQNRRPENTVHSNLFLKPFMMITSRKISNGFEANSWKIGFYLEMFYFRFDLCWWKILLDTCSMTLGRYTRLTALLIFAMKHETGQWLDSKKQHHSTCKMLGE